MEQDRISKLSLYSLGIVTKNKANGTDYIEVTPIEELPFASGPINDIKYEYDIKSVNAENKTSSSKIIGNNTLIAKWIPFGHSNRITAPDVCANETVILFKFADTDEYYWTTIFREPSIRRLETVCYAFSNIAKGLEAFDKTSSYWLEVSTNNKNIQLHTSKNDGEPFSYDIILDTNKGTLLVTDSIGNNIVLNSSESSVEITTNSSVTINTQTVNINANTTNISNDVNIGGNVVIAGSTEIGKSISIGASGSGGGSINGDLSSNGNISTNGNVTVSGSVAASGTVTGSNIS